MERRTGLEFEMESGGRRVSTVLPFDWDRELPEVGEGERERASNMGFAVWFTVQLRPIILQSRHLLRHRADTGSLAQR